MKKIKMIAYYCMLLESTLETSWEAVFLDILLLGGMLKG